ncbi:amino acid adenylation domain-containing protein [Gordonia aichiensis]
MTELSNTAWRDGVDGATTDHFDLSAAQSELWLAQHMYPSIPFSIAQYTDLRGPIDVGLLEEATARAGRELQSPQLRFALHGTQPRQFIDDDHDPTFDLVDLTDSADPAHDSQVWMDRDHQSAVDVVGNDINRAVVFRLGPQWHRCYGRIHHIAIDGYGAGQLLARGAQLYSAATQGYSPPPCRAMSLEDVVASDRDYRRSPRFLADRDYWRDNLAGLDRVTRLTDRHAPPSAHPHVSRVRLDSTTMSQLGDVGGRTDAGITEVIVAAVVVYLAQMTGDPDVTLSLPVAARTTAALRRSAGMVSNVVPLRVKGVPAHTVDDLVRQVRVGIIGALRHQLYRHEDLLRDLGAGVAGRSGYGPMINVVSFPDHIEFGEARGRAHLLSAGPVDDLTINCYRFGDGPLNVDFFANPALYDVDNLDRHRRQLLACLSRFLLASGDQRVSTLGSRNPGRAQGAEVSHAQSGGLLPDLLTAGVRSGDRIALRSTERALTYRELDAESSQWARVLIAHGAGPETVVAVMLSRSVESVVALWAVAKAGAVFFPIDPAAPAARMRTLLADSQAQLGVTMGRWRPVPGDDIDWLVLDEERFTSSAEGMSTGPVTDTERLRPLHAAHAAYLIYTSGSTGQPKGVLTTHGGLAALSDDLLDRYHVDEQSVVPQSHSPYCDAAMLEYLSAFASGAQLVVPPPDVVAGESLSQILQQHAVTHLMVTPTVLETLDADQLPALHTVAVGGDSCRPRVAEQWAGRVAMFNSYGPTEATVVVTQTDPLDARSSRVPIGGAVAGVRLYVLDERLNPVEHGARGELYLSGNALARGYLGRPGTTAGSFVANPYGPDGSRLYRTGDVVRELPDGTLEYVGRSDSQISLRGQRIEPSEVEAALVGHPEVDQAVVRMWSSTSLGDRLIGYVVSAHPDGDLDRAAVLAYLRTILPPAMIPAMLVVLPAIPINPSSGKADRSALPDPHTVARPPYRAPTSTTERMVAQGITDITRQVNVGLDDNFFELGGTSLTGVELCRRLSEQTGTMIGVSLLFVPTVEALSAAVEAAGSNDVGNADNPAMRTVLPLRGEGSGTPLICVHSAVPLAWCYSGLLRYVGDRPILGLQSPAIGRHGTAQMTVDDLTSVYCREIDRLRPVGPVHLLGWSLGGQLAHALAAQLRAEGREVGLVIMLDSVAFAEGVSPPAAPSLRDLVTHLEGNESEIADERPLSLDEAVMLLADSNGPGRGLTGAELSELHEGYVECVSMSVTYRPKKFDGDLLYFSAQRGVTAPLDATMWRPHVSGDIVEHRVDVTHAQMTNPEALGVIGPLLDAELRRRR